MFILLIPLINHQIHLIPYLPIYAFLRRGGRNILSVLILSAEDRLGGRGVEQIVGGFGKKAFLSIMRRKLEIYCVTPVFGQRVHHLTGTACRQQDKGQYSYQFVFHTLPGNFVGGIFVCQINGLTGIGE